MPVPVKNLPPQNVLEEWFAYEAGHLIWKKRARGAIGPYAEDNASKTCKYRKTSVPGYGRFLTHRIVWALHSGPIPEGKWVDHINQDKLDNRIENLRLTTWAENQRNTRAKNSTGLPKHVSKTTKNRYTVAVRVGTFDTIAEAEKVAAIANQLLEPLVGVAAN